MIGSKILHYTIIEKLGEGGMGEVYLAEDEKLHRRVALKFLHGDFEHDAEARDRLFREARAASRLSHANIVAIHAIEESDDNVFISMEYVEGDSLRTLVKNGEIDTARALEIAPQILAALAGAHETSVVHRDIKSDNIIITKSGRVKVLDFGLAKAKGSTLITRPGSSGGTPAYMSPEQVQGAPVDHRSDLFSFGVVLYEMLTGSLPFRGEHESAVTYSIVNETPEPLSKYRNDLPTGLQKIVDGCLEKDPGKRYQSAVEIEADLARVRAGGARLGTAAPVSRKGPSRVLTLAAAVVVVVAAALFFLTRETGDEPPAPRPAAVTASHDERPMLVVLPFENLGPTEQQYFADGITEEITTRLAKLSDLGVISRTSAMQYKDSDKSLREIAEELDVDYALEGSIRWDRTGDVDRVRVSTQLIRTADDTHLWADQYDRVYEQIFDLQSEIAEEVAKALNVTLIGPEMAALKERPTENLDAYDLYLKGREFWESGTNMEQRRAATEMVEKAVELDSSFATAQAFLARIYANDHFNNLHSEMPRLEQALEAARAALRSAPDQPQGHLAMGYYHYYGSRDYDDALKEFEQAASRQPNNAEIYEAMGYVLRRQGRWEEAVEKMRRSVELDPASLDKTINLIDTLIRMRRYEEADRWLARAAETLPNHPQIQVMRALREFMGGDLQAARSLLRTARERFGMEQLREFEAQIDLSMRDYDAALENMGTLGNRAYVDTLTYYSTKALVYDLKGEPERAEAYYDSSIAFAETQLARGEETYMLYVTLAEARAFKGDRDGAMAAIDRAIELMPMSRDAMAGTDVILNRAIVNTMLGNEDAAIDDIQFLLDVPSSVSREWLRQHPGFDSLRDNPRFEALMRGGSS